MKGELIMQSYLVDVVVFVCSATLTAGVLHARKPYSNVSARCCATAKCAVPPAPSSLPSSAPCSGR